MEPISVETLRATMEGVTRLVEASIGDELLDEFGLMLDGWSHASEHYVAVFAWYEPDGVAKTGLLSMAPIINEPEEDLSARTHRDVLTGMLEHDFRKQVSCCKYLVGDNCSVNKRLATMMQVPLVGCASHRLSRAVQHQLVQHEEDLAVVQALMSKLRTLKQSAKRRFKTPLRPIIRQDTRWGSTFAMVHRYFALLEFLDAEDEDIMDLLPSPACIRQLKKLHAELKDIESVSKALQAEDVNLLDVRVWFDELIAAHPAFVAYIGSRANIVHCPDFESGCVRVLKGSGVRPTAAETRALRPFIRPVQATEVEGEAVSTESFVQRIEKRRRIEAQETRYSLISSIPATSNKVERYFSVARTTLGQERNGMQPITLEMILFLRENARFWDVSAVDQLV